MQIEQESYKPKNLYSTFFEYWKQNYQLVFKTTAYSIFFYLQSQICCPNLSNKRGYLVTVPLILVAT